MRLLLVRHGETEWNAERRLQGQEDIRLSHRGREQALRLLPLIASENPSVVISSPLTRAVETAQILGFDRPTLDERWQEANLGSWTGMTAADVKVAADGEYEAWRAGKLTPPGAESFEAMTDRVTASVTALATGEATVLVVTHGGPIRAVCKRFVGLEPSSLVPVDPASLTIVDFADRARLRSYSLTMARPSDEPPD